MTAVGRNFEAGELVPALNECRTEVVRLIAKGDLSVAVLHAVHEDGEFIPHETELWDYKESVGGEKVDIAELARDIISFYNSFGGYILVGVNDEGQAVGAPELSAQPIRSAVKKYSGVDIAVAAAHIQWGDLHVCVIYVPKREVNQSPCAISRLGPEVSKGKVIFKPGDIFFRSDDSSQLIRGSDDLRFLIGERQHSGELRGRRGFHVVSNNLPDRSVIFSRFFGRDDVKESLWSWLADPFSKYRVIAGAGGIGKTSAIYSFCEEVCAEAPLGLEQVVWLSAKVNQFDAIEDRARQLPYQKGSRLYGQSYCDFESLLDAISYHLAISDEEWDGCGIHAKKRLVLDALALIRTIVVVDDLDSLRPDDQRTAVEFAMSLIGGESRIAFTTRKNYLAPAASTLELHGLDESAFTLYVSYLQELHKRKLNASEIRDLKSETSGSPLFVESVFRLLRLGERFSDALRRWKGTDGEAVRAACFQREVDQISFSGKRALFALAQFESAALSEVKRVAEMQTQEAESAIQELHGLFLIQSREIAGEARFSVSSSLRLMLEDVKDRIPNWAEIARRSKDLRRESKTGASRDSDRAVAMAIQQAMAQLGGGGADQAVRTMAGVIATYPKNADLQMVYARCLSRCSPPDVQRTRSAFQASFDLGKKEPQLFFKWLEFEIDVGNANAAIDVIKKAAFIIGDDDWRWLELRSKAYAKRGRERELRREWTDSVADWVIAGNCVSKALKFAPGPAKAQLVSQSQLINDARWRISASDSVTSEERFRVGLDAIRGGDRRDLCIHRLLDLIDAELSQASLGSRGSGNIDRWVADVGKVARGRLTSRVGARLEALSRRLNS